MQESPVCILCITLFSIRKLEFNDSILTVKSPFDQPHVRPPGIPEMFIFMTYFEENDTSVEKEN